MRGIVADCECKVFKWAHEGDSLVGRPSYDEGHGDNRGGEDVDKYTVEVSPPFWIEHIVTREEDIRKVDDVDHEGSILNRQVPSELIGILFAS